MFFRRGRRGTIIEEGLKITGSVSAEGLVEINGHIEGDVHCTSLIISHKAAITGGVEADRILVDGRVEGPSAAAKSCLSPTHTSWATSTISVSRSNPGPISRDGRYARCKPVSKKRPRSLLRECARQWS